MSQNRWLVVLLSSSLLILSGCRRAVVEIPKKEATVVVTTQSKAAEVRDFEEFTGRTDAILNVQIRSRVTGYLLKKNFLDGDEVHEGDVLYEIDDRPYKAALTAAEAQVAQGEAHRTRTEADFHRASNLFQRGTIGREEFDLLSSTYSEAIAALNASKALLEAARLNEDFTKVRSPMNGQLSRTLVDPGNLIVQDTTILNDIVMPDRLYVNFDINEESMERVRRLIDQGRIGSENGKEVKVEVGTSDDADKYEAAMSRLTELERIEQELTDALKNGKFPIDLRSRTYKAKPEAEQDLKYISNQIRIEKETMPKEFPYEGKVDFTENKLDAATGTLRVRGVIANPEPRILPGLFVRIHLPIGDPHPAVLVPPEAIGSNQGRSFVYVVDRDHDVEYRTVEVGPIYQEMRVIKSGLKPGEWIINNSDGISRVRPGSRVAPANEPSREESSKTSLKTAAR